jgi:small subunit ribosomal protein S3Ae
LSIVTFTQRRVNTSAKHEIRLLIDKMLNEKIIQLNLDQFIQEVTLGGLSKELLVESKRITFIRHLGIKKSKLISTPESRSIFEAKQIEAPSSITV